MFFALTIAVNSVRMIMADLKGYSIVNVSNDVLLMFRVKRQDLLFGENVAARGHQLH